MNTALTRIKFVCATIFVAGIAGIIVTSIASNNVGVITTIGLVTSVAAIVLLTATTLATKQHLEVFDDAVAERLEKQIVDLAAKGTDESLLRTIVRDAINLGRSSS